MATSTPASPDTANLRGAAAGPCPIMQCMAGVSASQLIDSQGTERSKGGEGEDSPPSQPPTHTQDMCGGFKCCFRGANEELEIEDYDEFLQKTKDKDLSNLAKYGSWVFQEVDFTAESEESWSRYNFSGCWFWGCSLPEHTTADEVRAQGAQVNENPIDLPFKPFRAFMYSSTELQKVDGDIYQHYLHKKDIRCQMYQAAHDYSMTDALRDYCEGKALIAFMGGHAMERHSDEYAQVVWLAWRLSRAGYVVATGGGPGAMQAANLGAYLCKNTEDDVKEALQLISDQAGNKDYAKNYLNPVPEQVVLDRFGLPTHMPSLAIPTWRYGHEPSNRFATFYAKFFSNAQREDILIDMACGGIIYFPGSAGTRQEIFQAACYNHYAEMNDVVPMVFYGKEFWSNPPLYDILRQFGEGRPFHDWLLLSDDIDEILSLFCKHATEQKLPLCRQFTKLMEAHWRK